MNGILEYLKSEPAAITGAVTAALIVAVDFGLIDTTQENHLLGLVGAVLALLGAGVTRQAVTPTSRTTTPLSGIHPAAIDTPAADSDEETDAAA